MLLGMVKSKDHRLTGLVLCAALRAIRVAQQLLPQRLERVPVYRGQRSVGNVAALVYDNCGRQTLNAIRRDDTVIRSGGIAYARLFQERLCLFETILLVHTEENYRAIFEMRPYRFQGGGFGTARRTPACPEVDNDDLAAQVTQA